jgi:hypothetical protein
VNEFSSKNECNFIDAYETIVIGRNDDIISKKPKEPIH